MQSCYAACMPNGRHEERRKRIFHAEWMVGIGGIIVRDRMLWWIVWPEKFSCSRFRDDSVGRNDGGEEYIRDFGPVEKRGRPALRHAEPAVTMQVWNHCFFTQSYTRMLSYRLLDDPSRHAIPR